MGFPMPPMMDTSDCLSVDGDQNLAQDTAYEQPKPKAPKDSSPRSCSFLGDFGYRLPHRRTSLRGPMMI